MRTYKTLVLVSLLIISHLVFSYNYLPGWWYSSIGTVFILTFSYLIWKREFLLVTGLKISPKSIMLAMAFTGFTIIVSIIYIKYIGKGIGAGLKIGDLRNYFHDVFYILNEEIMLGGIIIYLMTKKLRVPPLITSLLLACLFSVIHFVFYKWIFDDRGIITLTTLASLFLVGFVRNNLIIATGHISYSWALHFGWISVMFGSSVFWLDSGIELSEREKFNSLVGSVEMLVIAGFLAILSLALLLKRSVKVGTSSF
jgi:hypothetical protein